MGEELKITCHTYVQKGVTSTITFEYPIEVSHFINTV